MRASSMFPNPAPKSTRDKIIAILSEKKPLSIKEIHNAIRREHGFEGTYQAMHKAVVQATGDGILKKEGTKYVLDNAWINGVKDFGSAYLGEKYNLSELVKKDVLNLTFPKMISMAKFVINYYGQYPNPEKHPAILHWRHMWPIISLSDEEYIATKNILQLNGSYILSSSGNPLDKLSIDSFRKFGCKIKMDPSFKFNPDLVVWGDYIGYIYLGEGVKTWDNICGKIKNVDDMDLTQFYKLIFETKVEVNLIIAKNPPVAEQIRQETLRHFKEGAK